MKNYSVRAVVAVITVISLIFGCCGMGIFTFADSLKASVVVNDGSAKAANSTYNASYFTHSSKTGLSPDGKALVYKVNTTSHEKQFISIPLKTSNITDLGEVRAISFYLNIPSLSSGNYINLSFSAGAQQYQIIADKILVPDEGEIQELSATDALKPAQFEGSIILMLPKEDEIAVKANYGGAGEWTWSDFIAEKGLTSFGITFDANKAMRNKEVAFDTFTIHYNQDKALGDFNIALNLPEANVMPGFVTAGTTVALSADEGCDIYYTLDGSDPDKNSIKFSNDNLIVITKDTTLKAVAIKGEKASGIATYEYKLLSTDIPNTTILNNGENTADFTYKQGEDFLISAVNDSDVSPYGDAPVMTGASFSSAIMLSVEMEQIDKSLLSAQKAIAYWVQTPGSVPITPYFNNENYQYSGKKITYNSATGEIREYDADVAIPTTTPFEGWIILTLDGDIISQRWGYTGEKPVWNWQEWVADKGLANLQFYCAPAAVRGRTWTYDEFIAITDVNKFLDDVKAEGLRPNAPTSDMISGIVAKNATVELVSTEGAEIYYTLDCTRPNKQSLKYDPENPIVISEPLTLTAIAYFGELASSLTKYEYTFLDTTYPNTTILNDGEKVEDFIEKSGGVETVSATLSGTVSPYGNAPIMSTTTTSGAVMIGVPMKTMDPNILSAHQALAFWAKVPAGGSVSPCIDNQRYPFKGTMVTYNSSTGDITEYENTSGISFKADFEGWIILKLEGVCVQEVSWSGTQKWTWRQRALSYGLSSIQFYTTNSHYYGKQLTYDEFTAVIDYDKFMEQIKAEGLRPMSPSADPRSDAVPASTNINLTAGDGTTIYYTVDGSDPAFDANNQPLPNTLKYVMIGMGNGQPDASPIAITDTEKETVVKAVAMDNTTGKLSGIAVYTYTVEPPYDGPNSIVVNDGRGEGKQTFGWHNTDTWTSAVVENDSENGKGLQLTTSTKDRIVQEMSFAVDSSSVKQLHNFEAVSFHVSVPKLPKASDRIGMSPRVSGTSNYLYGKAYTISDTGEVVKYTDASVGFNGFSGTVLIIFPKTNTVGTSYGSKVMSWFDFIKAKGLTSVGFYFTKNAFEADHQIDIVWDDFTVHYDVDKYLEEIGLEDLLANYGAGTFENTNMMVANDGSGKKVNSGITSISDNLTVEQSNYSPDERNFKLTFGAGNANITLPDYCEDEMAIIGDGMTFWVDMLSGTGDVPLEVLVTEAGSDGTELHAFADNKWFYRIDRDGVIEKVSGKLTIPNGFRGWIILPNDYFNFLEKQSVFNDGEINYEAVANVSITFINNGGLTDKSIYFDDLSYYTDFAALVKSRALRWHENTLALAAQNGQSLSSADKISSADVKAVAHPITVADGAEHSHSAIVPVCVTALLAVSVLIVLTVGKKRIV